MKMSFLSLILDALEADSEMEMRLLLDDNDEVWGMIILNVNSPEETRVGDQVISFPEIVN
jgi:hypothetical protein